MVVSILQIAAAMNCRVKALPALIVTALLCRSVVNGIGFASTADVPPHPTQSLLQSFRSIHTTGLLSAVNGSESDQESTVRPSADDISQFHKASLLRNHDLLFNLVAAAKGNSDFSFRFSPLLHSDSILQRKLPVSGSKEVKSSDQDRLSSHHRLLPMLHTCSVVPVFPSNHNSTSVGAQLSASDDDLPESDNASSLPTFDPPAAEEANITVPLYKSSLASSDETRMDAAEHREAPLEAAVGNGTKKSVALSDPQLPAEGGGLEAEKAVRPSLNVEKIGVAELVRSSAKATTVQPERGSEEDTDGGMLQGFEQTLPEISNWWYMSPQQARTGWLFATVAYPAGSAMSFPFDDVFYGSYRSQPEYVPAYTVSASVGAYGELYGAEAKNKQPPSSSLDHDIAGDLFSETNHNLGDKAATLLRGIALDAGVLPHNLTSDLNLQVVVCKARLTDNRTPPSAANT